MPQKCYLYMDIGPRSFILLCACFIIALMIQTIWGESLWGPTLNVVVSISHVCITLNSSCNFAVYCSKEAECHWIIELLHKVGK